eukprot:8160516-Pyramimonas_sp.AAC.1
MSAAAALRCFTCRSFIVLSTSSLRKEPHSPELRFCRYNKGVCCAFGQGRDAFVEDTSGFGREASMCGRRTGGGATDPLVLSTAKMDVELLTRRRLTIGPRVTARSSASETTRPSSLNSPGWANTASVSQSVGRSDSQSVGRSVSRPVDRSVSRSDGAPKLLELSWAGKTTSFSTKTWSCGVRARDV